MGTSTRGRRDVLIIHPYGFITELDNSGSAGSKAQIERARELIRHHKVAENCVMVFPQGYYPHRPESLGENMVRYIRSLSEFKNVYVLQSPCSRGTATDTIAAYDMVEKDGIDRSLMFHFVTDPVHMRRVRLIWFLTHPRYRGWQATFHPAYGHQMTARERNLREPLARVKDAVRLLPVFVKRLIGR